MKRIILLLLAFSLVTYGMAQGKGKEKKAEKTEKVKGAKSHPGKELKEKADKEMKSDREEKAKDPMKGKKDQDVKKVKDKSNDDDQGENDDDQKPESKKTDKDFQKERKHEDVIWEGTEGRNGKGPKATNKTPNKVGRAFSRDYPNAVNVSWTKYRGDWTATFGNGLTRSTAVYHANGERRDTRSIVSRDSIPVPVIKKAEEKNRTITLGDIIKINLPDGQNIYRAKEQTTDKPLFRFFDKDGREVKYDY